MSYYKCNKGHAPKGGEVNCPYCLIDTLQKDNDTLNTDLKEAEGAVADLMELNDSLKADEDLSLNTIVKLKAEVVELVGQRDIDLVYWSNMANENKHRPVEEAARLFSDICNILSSVQKEDECLFVTAMNLAERAEKAEAERDVLIGQAEDHAMAARRGGKEVERLRAALETMPCGCVEPAGNFGVRETCKRCEALNHKEK